MNGVNDYVLLIHNWGYSMKRIISSLILIIFLIVLFPNVTYCQDDLKIRKKFVNTLKEGNFHPDKIHPYHVTLKEPLPGFLKEMRGKATWK